MLKSIIRLVFIPAAGFSYTLFRKLHLKVIHKVCVVLVAAVALKQHIHLGLPAIQLLIAELVEVFFMWVRAPLCSQALLYSETPEVVTENRVESLQLCHRHRFQVQTMTGMVLQSLCSPAAVWRRESMPVLVRKCISCT